ncbi:MAG: MBL fold metallo-hydrolase [Chlorobi bacterium]|nr:MBL fold metallo-hydrolase [Chlorobiota bacterium]
MKIKFLGTGTSQGVPVIGCNCDVCQSMSKYDKRLRSSVLVETADSRFTIDAGPDFRYQMLRQNINDIDGILITHCHKDHIAGLDDVRAFNYLRKKDMPVYACKRDQQAIKREFSYAFGENIYPGVPRFKLMEFDEDAFYINNTLIKPLKALHQRMEVSGFRVGSFAYITDTHYIPPSTLAQISDCKVVVLSAVRKQPHPSHFSLQQAVDILEFLRPEQGIITHISHLMGRHEEVNKELPAFIELAYDGMEIRL